MRELKFKYVYRQGLNMRELKFKYVYRRWNDIKAYVFRLDEIEYLDRFFDDIGLHFSSFSDFDKYMIRDGYKLIAKCKYAGLKDKNGKEIYEWDILKTQKTKSLFIVEWDYVYVGFALINVETKDTYPLIDGIVPLEIVGNIYENPELLETKK